MAALWRFLLLSVIMTVVLLTFAEPLAVRSLC